MQNKINFEIGAKAIITGEVCGPDGDLRDGDVVEFVGFDERSKEQEDWKDMLADEVDGDTSRLRGAFLKLVSDGVVGWWPVDVLTNTILSY